MQGAQNQHYIPKFILRQFLADPVEKEQVYVFDKRTNRSFRTSIVNIMAERKYNDFKFQGLEITFEPSASAFENVLVPTYQNVVQKRHLEGTPEEKATLAVLIAFQLARTRNARQQYVDMEAQVRLRVEAAGGSMQQLEGWEPLTDDVLKQLSISAMRESLGEYSQLICQKDFFLMEAPTGASFYLGDDPICLINERNFDPYGNLGLALPGIQISMPLASGLMLCCWCPTVVADLSTEFERRIKPIREDLLRKVVNGKIKPDDMKRNLDAAFKRKNEIPDAIASGEPLTASAENVRYYNAKQMGNALRHVICARGDFNLALEFNKKHPGARRAIKFG